ncbi:MAG: M15 family metallopeptidase [Ruminococcus sp.]|nr:M15 family metallopeptidase [Ruminococcus sp.]
MVAFMPSGDKTVDPPAADVPASNESIQNSPPQSASDPSVASEPIAAGTWKLVLVNPWNPLPENYTVQTVTLQNGLQVDERCYPDLQAMMDACRADGLTPVICSAYRTQEVQESLYQQEVGRYLDKGYDQDAAEAEAGKSVAVPGTSEHQLGLAVDIVDIDHQLLDESQENTEVQKWLMAHSWEYGFILRYPTGKSEITGIIYEPWHYRYVGRDDAKQIHALGVCLEEYLAD